MGSGGVISRRSLLSAAGIVGGAAIVASCAPATPQAATGPAETKKEAAASEQASEQVTVSYWTPPLWPLGADGKTVEAPPDDWLNDAVARFEADNPGIKVDAQLVPWDQWAQTLGTTAAAGSWPNIVYRGLTYGEFGQAANMALKVEGGIVEPIDQFITDADRADIGKADWDIFTYKDHVWSWPLFLNPSILAINKSIFQDRGAEDLLPKEPARSWTFAEFLTAAQAVTYSSSGGSAPDVYGFVMPGDGNFYWSMAYWLFAYGGKKYSDDGLTVLLDDPRTIEYLEFMLALQNEHKVMVPDLPPGADASQFFMDKRVAMRTHWGAIIQQVESGIQSGTVTGPFEVMLTHVPFQPDVPLARYGGGNELTLMKTPDPATLEAAGELLRFLTNTENSKAWGQQGLFPVRKSAAEGLYSQPDLVWISEQVLPLDELALKDLPGGFNVQVASALRDAKLDDLIREVWQSVMLGSATPEEACTTAAKQANEAIAKALAS